MSTTKQPKKGTIGVLALTLYLDLVGFSLAFPIYSALLDRYEDKGGPLFETFMNLVGQLGVSDEVTRKVVFLGAFMTFLYAIMQFVVTPFWGRLSDRVGRRKVLLVSLTINLLGYLLWAFAGSFWVFFISRLIAAFASGNISVASAAIADASPPEQRSRAMGFAGMAIGFGFITGPMIGATHGVMPVLGDATGLGLHPFSAIALLSAVLALWNLVWLARRYQDAPSSDQKVVSTVGRSINPLRILRKDLGPDLAKLNLSWLGLTCVFAGFEATLVFLASGIFSWGVGQIGVYMGVIGLVSALVQGGLVRRYAPKIGEAKLAIVGAILYAPAMGLLILAATSASSLGMWTGGCLLGLGIGLTSPTLSALASLGAPAGAQGLAMGSYRSAGALGRAIGPLIAGVAWLAFGAPAPYIAGLIILVPCALVLYRLRIRAAQ